MSLYVFAGAVSLLLSFGAPAVFPTSVAEARPSVASWYGPGLFGNLTANGEVCCGDFTAAHKTLPFGTMLRVVNPDNDRDVVVRVNDRGPYVGDRELDLSPAAAEAIGLVEKGVGVVEVLDP